MATRILTDSASDISQEKARELGVKVLPLKIRFDQEEYLDGVTLSAHDFYKKMESTGILPKTSQITPYEFEQEFKEAADAGDDLIYFAISSGVSGTCHSAAVAAKSFAPHVTVIDTEQFCVSEAVLVEEAVRLREAGRSYEEIVAAIRKDLKKAHVVAVFDTLEYLRKGGRLSAATAFAGTLLSIKPVLTITDGIVDVLGKARGSRGRSQMMIQTIRKLGGIDFDRPVWFAYSGCSDSLLQKFIEDSKELYRGLEKTFPVATAGAAIGTYAGPGAIAIAFFSKE